MANLLRTYISSLFKTLQTNFLDKPGLVTSILISFSGLVFYLDPLVLTQIEKLQCHLLEAISLSIGFLFHTIPTLLLLISIFWRAKLHRNEQLKIKSIQSITLLLVSIVIGMLIKLFFLRERPYVSACPYHFFVWKHFTWKTYNNFFSTPSGHVMSAICTYFLWPKRYLSMFVALILLVSFFRLYSLMHWFSDIFLSWAICLLLTNKPPTHLGLPPK